MLDKEMYITIPKKDYDELLGLKEGKSIKVMIYEDQFSQNYVMTTNKIVASMANVIKRNNDVIKILTSENYDLKEKISKKKFLGLL